MNKIVFKILLIIITTFYSCIQANALQAIISVPSSDVLKKNAILLKESTIVSPGSARRVNTNPSFNIGLGWGTEVSIGVPINIKFEDGTATEKINIEAKKVFYLGSDTNRLTIGTAIAPSLNMPVCPDTYLYMHATKVIPKTRTALTAGGYMTGTQHLIHTGGAILAVDQGIIGNKLKAQAEWSSGYNNRSNFGVGLKYRPKDDLSIAGAVIIPMKESDNVGFQLTLSKFFFPKEKDNL